MTLLHDAVKEKKFDVRMVERNVARGVVTAEEAEKALASLPDDAENAETISLDALIADDSGEKTSH